MKITKIERKKIVTQFSNSKTVKQLHKQLAKELG